MEDIRRRPLSSLHYRTPSFSRRGLQLPTGRHKILLTYEFPPRGVDPPLFIGAYLMSNKDDDPILCRLNSLEFRDGVPSEFRGSHYQLVHLVEQHIYLPSSLLLFASNPRSSECVTSSRPYENLCHTS